MDDVLKAVIWVAGSVAAAICFLHLFWRLRSFISVRRAAERPLHSTRTVIWRQPLDIESLDLAAGPGGPEGAPLERFTFVEEHIGGSRPCVSVRDARGRKWRLKWGDEVRTETLATRLAWAAGYFVETTYYVREGRIDGVEDLHRARGLVNEDGRFCDARFELDEEGVIKHFDEHSWAWNDNPFVGTRELNGLKIVMMWLSNWDAKDVRDVARGSNTAIFEYLQPDGFREARYLIIDWGAAFGRWGSIMRRGRWDCEAFAAESETLVQGIDGEHVHFGYTGQRTADIARGIRVSDVQWLMRTLGRVSDSQIAAAVAASGGTAEEVTCFTRALRVRLNHLEAVTSQRSHRPASPASRLAAAP